MHSTAFIYQGKYNQIITISKISANQTKSSLLSFNCTSLQAQVYTELLSLTYSLQKTIYANEVATFIVLGIKLLISLVFFGFKLMVPFF